MLVFYSSTNLSHYYFDYFFSLIFPIPFFRCSITINWISFICQTQFKHVSSSLSFRVFKTFFFCIFVSLFELHSSYLFKSTNSSVLNMIPLLSAKYSVDFFMFWKFNVIFFIWHNFCFYLYKHLEIEYFCLNLKIPVHSFLLFGELHSVIYFYWFLLF